MWVHDDQLMSKKQLFLVVITKLVDQVKCERQNALDFSKATRKISSDSPADKFVT